MHGYRRPPPDMPQPGIEPTTLPLRDLRLARLSEPGILVCVVGRRGGSICLSFPPLQLMVGKWPFWRRRGLEHTYLKPWVRIGESKICEFLALRVDRGIVLFCGVPLLRVSGNVFLYQRTTAAYVSECVSVECMGP